VYERAKDAVALLDSDMNTYINGFLKWLVHDTDELPERPPKPGSTGEPETKASRPAPPE
jgi:hypothetical protein